MTPFARSGPVHTADQHPRIQFESHRGHQKPQFKSILASRNNLQRRHRPVTLVTERRTRIRRACRSTSPTRSAVAPPNPQPAVAEPPGPACGTDLTLYSIPVASAKPLPLQCQKPDLFYANPQLQATRLTPTDGYNAFYWIWVIAYPPPVAPPPLPQPGGQLVTPADLSVQHAGRQEDRLRLHHPWGQRGR